MSSLFNGNNFVLPFEDHTVNLKAKASTNISIGDFVCWDSANKVLVPVDVNVAGVTDDAGNIAYDVGTLVKAVAGSPTTVATTTKNAGDAIGYIVAQYDSATTKVRVRLISPLFSPYVYAVNKA